MRNGVAGKSYLSKLLPASSKIIVADLVEVGFLGFPV
jgi:hypothetical protein